MPNRRSTVSSRRSPKFKNGSKRRSTKAASAVGRASSMRVSTPQRLRSSSTDASANLSKRPPVGHKQPGYQTSHLTNRLEPSIFSSQVHLRHEAWLQNFYKQNREEKRASSSTKKSLPKRRLSSATRKQKRPKTTTSSSTATSGLNGTTFTTSVLPKSFLRSQLDILISQHRPRPKPPVPSNGASGPPLLQQPGKEVRPASSASRRLRKKVRKPHTGSVRSSGHSSGDQSPEKNLAKRRRGSKSKMSTSAHSSGDQSPEKRPEKRRRGSKPKSTMVAETPAIQRSTPKQTETGGSSQVTAASNSKKRALETTPPALPKNVMEASSRVRVHGGRFDGQLGTVMEYLMDHKRYRINLDVGCRCKIPKSRLERIRPISGRQTSPSTEFKMFDKVQAKTKRGWCTGIVIFVLEDGDETRYNVKFDRGSVGRHFKVSSLRRFIAGMVDGDTGSAIGHAGSAGPRSSLNSARSGSRRGSSSRSAMGVTSRLPPRLLPSRKRRNGAPHATAAKHNGATTPPATASKRRNGHTSAPTPRSCRRLQKKPTVSVTPEPPSHPRTEGRTRRPSRDSPATNAKKERVRPRSRSAVQHGAKRRHPGTPTPNSAHTSVSSPGRRKRTKSTPTAKSGVSCSRSAVGVRLSTTHLRRRSGRIRLGRRSMGADDLGQSGIPIVGDYCVLLDHPNGRTLVGEVKWSGELEGLGLRYGMVMQNAPGSHDGLYKKRRYYDCPRARGIWAKPEDIVYILPKSVSRHLDSTLKSRTWKDVAELAEENFRLRVKFHKTVDNNKRMVQLKVKQNPHYKRLRLMGIQKSIFYNLDILKELIAHWQSDVLKDEFSVTISRVMPVKGATSKEQKLKLDSLAVRFRKVLKYSRIRPIQKRLRNSTKEYLEHGKGRCYPDYVRKALQQTAENLELECMLRTSLHQRERKVLRKDPFEKLEWDDLKACLEGLGHDNTWLQEAINVYYESNKALSTLNAADPHVFNLSPLLNHHPGDTGLIISIPHDGGVGLKCHKRLQGQPARDTYTSEMGNAMRDRLVEYGIKPYFVELRCSRAWVDVNRSPTDPPGHAFDTSMGRMVYDMYHGQIEQYIDDCLAKHKHIPLMLDIHCNKKRKLKGYMTRGTCSGRSMKPYIDTYGRECVLGPNSFFGQLDSRKHSSHLRYECYPHEKATGDPLKEEVYSGGYNTQHYGDMICCMQIEVNGTFRENKEDSIRTGIAMAKSMRDFLKSYPMQRIPIKHGVSRRHLLGD